MTVSRGHAWYTLAVLFGINTMNFYDRQVLPAVQEKIRAAWHLTDAQLGWFGTGFILLYAIVGVPFGRLADVRGRAWLLAIGVAIWSVLTAGSAFAWSFASLLVLRLGVGVGEAVCAPTGTALIGDLFPPQRRALPMALFMLGLPIGLALSFTVSGVVAARFSWQAAFLVAGLPGLAFAMAAVFVADPARGSADGRPHATTTAPETTATWQAGVRLILRIPTMWWIIASGALHNFNMTALGTFLASFLKRYHGVEVDVAGQISGLVYGVGAVGMYAGGWLADWAFRRRVSGRLEVATVTLGLALPCLLLALAVPGRRPWLFAAWFLPACVMLYTYYGTVYAAIQDITPPSHRGLAMSVYICTMYLLGAVFGPLATGWVSDALAARAMRAAGELAMSDASRAIGLHQSLYLIPLLNAVLVFVLFQATRTVANDCQQRGASS